MQERGGVGVQMFPPRQSQADLQHERLQATASRERHLDGELQHQNVISFSLSPSPRARRRTNISTGYGQSVRNLTCSPTISIQVAQR